MFIEVNCSDTVRPNRFAREQSSSFEPKAAYAHHQKVMHGCAKVPRGKATANSIKCLEIRSCLP